MGTFNTEIAIGDLGRERWAALDALVDTGAIITCAPASLLHGLGVEPLRKQAFTFANGETWEMDIGQAREMEIGQAWVRVADRAVITPVMFNEEGSMPLLGALTLESLFLEVDPVGKRLVPVGGVMGAAEGGALPIIAM